MIQMDASCPGTYVPKVMRRLSGDHEGSPLKPLGVSSLRPVPSGLIVAIAA
jgi:hypothetical protein